MDAILNNKFWFRRNFVYSKPEDKCDLIQASIKEFFEGQVTKFLIFCISLIEGGKLFWIDACL